MAEDKKEPWLNYLGLTSVILAACAALATGLFIYCVLSGKMEDLW